MFQCKSTTSLSSSRVSIKKEEQESSSQKKAVDNLSERYTLETTFKDEELVIKLKLFDLQEETVSFFSLTLTDQTLTDSLSVAFGSAKKIFDTCFEKKQNYRVEDNGRIAIDYEILLKSDKFSKVLYLHLLNEEKSPKQSFKSIIAKLKEKQMRNKQKLQREMKDIVNSLNFNYPILTSDSCQNVILNGNTITSLKEKTFLQFRTDMIDSNHFQFKIEMKEIDEVCIGIAYQNQLGKFVYSSHFQHYETEEKQHHCSQRKKSNFFNKKEKKSIHSKDDISYSLIVDKQQKSITFIIKDKEMKYQLKEAQIQNSLIPFVFLKKASVTISTFIESLS